jgi:protein SCO1
MTRVTKIGLVATMGMLFLSAGLYASLFTLGVLPLLGFAPGFSLVDERGARLTSEDLRGTVVLYTFTQAAGEVPYRDTAPVMRQVQAALEREDTGEIPVRLVTVVLDAPPDQPAAPLEAAARAAGADVGRWTFAAGAPASLVPVVRDGFGVWFEPRPDGGVSYDPTFVVVDGMGIVRARYRVGLPPADALLRDLRSIVREARAAEGPARLAYSAAHLFQCYPPR